MCATHITHSFTNSCDNHNTIGMEAGFVGESDIICLPLPHAEKSLTALWMKVSLLVWEWGSQAQISRMRGFFPEPMPIEVWKILHGLLIITPSCWFVQITSLCPSTRAAHIHMYKRDMVLTLPHTHKHMPRRKTTTLRRAFGESMQKPILCR